MKIGILTLPLHINYGGILQAYALQTILQQMGHEVLILDRRKRPHLPHYKKPYIYAKRILRKYLKGERNQTRVFREQYYNKTYEIISRNISTFIDKYINRLIVCNFNSLSSKNFDAIVVGSDQVWRPIYFGEKQIKNAYLDFTKEWNIKKVAYSVSFGTNQWEYSPQQTKRCSRLAQNFDAVSVRENSAIKLCQQQLNVNAIQTLDPTMLLAKEDYIRVVEEADTSKPNGTLLTYILDSDKNKEAIINQIADKEELIPYSANIPKAKNIHTPIEEQIQPSIEQWLRGFMDAEFIITDSFHGTVFAILFQKPFITIANKERGTARMESLLSILSLDNRLVSNIKEAEEMYHQPINYKAVNNLLEKHRAYSTEFLRSKL